MTARTELLTVPRSWNASNSAAPPSMTSSAPDNSPPSLGRACRIPTHALTDFIHTRLAQEAA